MDKGIHIFPEGIGLKVKVITWLDFDRMHKIKPHQEKVL